jgi:hypothetical protein
MDFSNLAEQVNDVFDSIFSGGSRYQMEKLVTVAVYTIVAVGSLVWAFSGGGSDNDLGAKFEVEELAEIDDVNFYLSNDGSKDWSRVRVVLNRMYLWTTDEIAADTRKTLGPNDFDYYFHVPRRWGGADWELLTEVEKPGAHAPTDLNLELVEIRAREGRSDIAFKNGKPVVDEGQENVAQVD